MIAVVTKPLPLIGTCRKCGRLVTLSRGLVPAHEPLNGDGQCEVVNGLPRGSLPM